MKRTFLVALSLWLVGVASVSAATKSLSVDHKQSRIEVDVKATMGSFVGHLADYDATIAVDESGSAVKSAVIAFKFADVKTGEDKRDHHMHDWQETEKYPDARFELVKLAPAEGGAFDATGKLTLHGQTQELSFPVQITTEGDTLVIDGEAVVNTERFGLPIIRKFLALKVNPDVTVRFHLQGKLAPAAD
ncbi:YceI family protein [Actomonas aquatica]|uniref:YceI family protein n=1 Tax=Actomonas aquatica TaxID=2866162 RepID=A0ABZ1C7H0_9BACT|nr:YceI family protein [Opitutus sp. WL0086]WRQ86469.1 YceI family protein [Opitutus sp. WL0086]